MDARLFTQLFKNAIKGAQALQSTLIWSTGTIKRRGATVKGERGMSKREERHMNELERDSERIEKKEE